LPRLFTDETKEKLDHIQTIVDEEERRVQMTKFNRRVKKRREELKEKEKMLKRIMKEKEGFFTSNTLYPRQFTENFTLAEIYLDRVREYSEKNPLKEDMKIKLFIESQKDAVKNFRRVKNKMLKIFPKVVEYRKSLYEGSTSYLEILKIEQEMALNLQGGRVDIVEEKIKEFNDILKERKK